MHGWYHPLELTLTKFQVTLFAPNNAAIKALQQSGALQGITEAEVQAVLNYHVVPGVIPAKKITNVPTVAPTLLTEEAYTTVTGGEKYATSY